MNSCKLTTLMSDRRDNSGSEPASRERPGFPARLPDVIESVKRAWAALRERLGIAEERIPVPVRVPAQRSAPRRPR